MSPERIVNYLNSYGKDFPSPIDLIGQTIVDRDAGQKISPETREFVLKEVSWQLGGFAKEKEFAAKIGELLDKANAMTPEECKKAWLLHGPLRAEFEKVRRTTAGNVTPLTMLEHVMKQDIAELLSNSRLLPAMDARISYLKKAGYDMEKKAYHKDDVK
jgi:hypothetical protein